MKSLGIWSRYVPEEWPLGAPAGANFWRNAEGVDWYSFVYSTTSPPKDPAALAMMVADGLVVCIDFDLTAFSPIDGAEVFALDEDDAIPELGEFLGPKALRPYVIYKSTLIRRLTSTEANKLEAVIASEDAWLRMLWNASEYIISTDAMMAYLSHVIGLEHGEERAAVLLAAP